MLEKFRPGAAFAYGAAVYLAILLVAAPFPEVTDVVGRVVTVLLPIVLIRWTLTASRRRTAR